MGGRNLRTYDISDGNVDNIDETAEETGVKKQFIVNRALDFYFQYVLGDGSELTDDQFEAMRKDN